MNPYLVQFMDLQSQHEGYNFWTKCKIMDKAEYCSCPYDARRKLCNQYSFAIPSEEAIAKIASFGKILEIGAGTGYWAKLISEAGAEVAAIDLAPVGGSWKNEWAFSQKHYPVEQGNGWEWVETFTPEYTLMMCWPPMDNMAADCLSATKGDYVIYIGEGSGGCTADDSFFDMIEPSREEGSNKPWKIEEIIGIPHWPSVHDCLYILKRK